MIGFGLAIITTLFLIVFIRTIIWAVDSWKRKTLFWKEYVFGDEWGDLITLPGHLEMTYIVLLSLLALWGFTALIYIFNGLIPGGI